MNQLNDSISSNFHFFISNLIKFTIMTTFNNKTFWDNIVFEEDAI